MSLRDLFRKAKRGHKRTPEMSAIRISEEDFLKDPQRFRVELGGPTPVVLIGPHGEIRTIIGVAPGIVGQEPELPSIPARPKKAINQRAWLD